MRVIRQVFSNSFLTGLVLVGLVSNASIAGSTDDQVASEQVSERRAKFNYQMFCQGCHAADGSGHKSVPELKGFIHNFMTSQLGREYLIRVPGAANSVLDNNELAEVMNWMLDNFGQRQAVSWEPYSAEEVGRYRQTPLNETIKYRENLIVSLKQDSKL